MIPERVSVFCPTPLLTVTIEAPSDETTELHVHAGGQGFWVARMVARLGLPVQLCAPLGGDTGRMIRVAVTEEKVELGAVAVTGTNGSYVHDRRGGERVEICRIAGEPLSRHEVDDLYNVTFAAGLESGVLALTGQYPEAVVPSDMYGRLAADLRANGRKVVADLSGEDLAGALAGGLDILCLSHEQLVDDGYASGEEPSQLVEGIEHLHEAGAVHVIVHRGDQSTFASVDGETWEVITPHVEPLDHRGGGDTFFAALTVQLTRGCNFVDALRYAAAAGTLNVTRHGLGTGRPGDIEAVSHHVEVRPLKL